MKKSFALIIAIFWAFCVCAQDRTDSMHVAHYDLHLDILDFTAKTINGYADLTMVSKVNNLPAYVLDLQGLTVDSVFVNGQSAVFTHANHKITIPHNSQASDTDIVRIHYHGAPIRDSYIGGFYYVGQYCYNIGVAFEYQPHTFGRCWIPCLDYFTDKSTYTMHIHRGGQDGRVRRYADRLRNAGRRHTHLDLGAGATHPGLSGFGGRWQLSAIRRCVSWHGG